MFYFLIFFLILSFVGIYLLAKQFKYGLKLTNINENNPWGLFVAGANYFSSLGSGLLFIVAVTVITGVALPQSLFLSSQVFSIGFFIGSFLLLTANAGRPLKFIKNLFKVNLQSPLTWFVLLIDLSILMNILALLGLKLQIGQFSLWALFTLLISLLFIMLLSFFIFIHQSNKDLLLNLNLLIRSLLEGTSLLGLIGLLVMTTLEQVALLVPGLLVLIVLNLVIIAMTAYANKKPPSVYRYIPLIMAAIFLATPISITLGIAFSGLLVLISGFYERFEFIMLSQNVNYAMPEGMFYKKKNYSASLHEWALLVGVAGIAILIGGLGAYFIN